MLFDNGKLTLDRVEILLNLKGCLLFVICGELEYHDLYIQQD